ncbi:hypothetical protein ID142_12525, partial [Escherichia coli]
MANIEIRQETPTAFYIKVHDTDNVAIIVNDNGLKAGTRFPGNDSNLLIVFYVQIMPDDFVMQLHR